MAWLMPSARPWMLPPLWAVVQLVTVGAVLRETAKAASGCYCDVTCYYFRTCCDDITANGCYRKNTVVASVFCPSRWPG